MQKQISTGDVETTDILARKEGMFESYSVIGAMPTQLEQFIESDRVEPVDIPSEADIFLLELESVDGQKVVSRPSTRHVIYNGQGESLRKIVNQEYGYVCDGMSAALVDGYGWNVAVTPTAEDARYLSEKESDLKFSLLSLKPFLERLQIQMGFKAYPSWDKLSSRAVTALSKEVEDIGWSGPIKRYLHFVTSIPHYPKRAKITEIESHSEMSILINGSQFKVKFDGRPTEPSHVPTQLAEEIGVGTPENLEREVIKVASGQYTHKKTNMNVIGTNSSGVICVGV